MDSRWKPSHLWAITDTWAETKAKTIEGSCVLTSSNSLYFTSFGIQPTAHWLRRHCLKWAWLPYVDDKSRKRPSGPSDGVSSFLDWGSLFSAWLQLMTSWQKLTSKRWQSLPSSLSKRAPAAGIHTAVTDSLIPWTIAVPSSTTSWMHLPFFSLCFDFLWGWNKLRICGQCPSFLPSSKTWALPIMLNMLGSAPRIQNLKRWEWPKMSLQGINYYFPWYEDDSKHNGKGVAAYLDLEVWNF